MKKKLTITAVIVAIVLIFTCIFAFSPKISVDRDLLQKNSVQPSAKAVYLDEELTLSETGYSLVGACGDNELLFNPSDYTIRVRNVKTGYVWSSMVTDDDYIHNAKNGMTANTEAVLKKFRRLFEIGYTNFGELDLNTSIAENDYATVNLHKLQNGVAVETEFSSCGIGVTVEFWLDEDGLNVRVPRDKVKEADSTYGLLSLKLLPMFGASTDQYENGFILFPDTTGGIYNFKPVTGRQSPLTTDIYFPRDFDLDDIESNNKQGVKNAMMPFFGLSRGDEGFVGYITEGEMNSSITLNPSGAVYYLNRVEPSISYRKSYTYLNPAGKEITETESAISAGDFSVHYSFISAPKNGSVTYSAMANTLRKYLVDTDRLVQTETAKEAKIRSNLQMLMTVKTETMIAEYLQAMTKCSDIQKIVDKQEESLRSELRIMLLGWQSSGYNVYPDSGKVAGEIGSLKNLFSHLKEQNIETYLVNDLIQATTDSPKFSKQSDAVYNEARLPVTNSVGDTYVRNPYKEYVKLAKRMPSYKKMGVSGLGFDKLGWYVFDDYQKRVELSRYDTISAYRAMLNLAHENGMKNAVQRGNSYILSQTDYIYDVPSRGSSLELIDVEIPFYQLVIHGYIPYSTDTPGNMSVDYQNEILNWIECGAEPNFLLTQEMSEKFKDSKVENAFSTELSNWLDKAVSLTEQFNEKLAFTANCTIIEHTVLSDKVVCVRYENGSRVYVNHNEKEVTVDNVPVAAEGYTVVHADGSVVR